MFKDRRFRTGLAVAAVCVAGGVIAGIAGSAAAPSRGSGSSAASPSASQRPWPPRRRGLRFGPGPVVHADVIIPNRGGTGFAHVTIDAGRVQSVSGDQLTITEGTPKATYKTVTLTIPASAVVRRNWASAKLSDLQPGDRVRVRVGPRATFVNANDAKHALAGRGRGFRRFGGPDGAPPPGGPPPGGPLPGGTP